MCLIKNVVLTIQIRQIEDLQHIREAIPAIVPDKGTMRSKFLPTLCKQAKLEGNNEMGSQHYHLFIFR